LVDRNQSTTIAVGKDLAAEICRSTSDIRAGVKKSKEVTKSAAKDVTIELLRQSSESRGLADRNFAHSTSLAKDQQLEMSKMQHVLERQASDNVKFVELDALRNKEHLARQLAECCCEIKEKIGESADKTNALISTLDLNKTRDELAKINTENMMLRLKASDPCCKERDPCK